MTSDDPLLAAWEETLVRKRHAAAIFNTDGTVARTFQQVDDEACEFARKIDIFESGGVIAVQIGNHASWPAVLVGCLRKGLVVAPVDESMPQQQRDAALEVCNAASIVAAAVSGACPTMPAGLFTAKYTPGCRTEAAIIAMTATIDSASMPPYPTIRVSGSRRISLGVVPLEIRE